MSILYEKILYMKTDDKHFFTSWIFSHVLRNPLGYFLDWTLLTFQSCDFVLLVESQRLSRLENYEQIRWPCPVFRDLSYQSANTSRTHAVWAAFQKQEGGARENEFFLSTKILRQLKTLALSFFNVFRFQSLPLFERLCGTLAMEAACLRVKLTFGYRAGRPVSFR